MAVENDVTTAPAVEERPKVVARLAAVAGRYAAVARRVLVVLVGLAIGYAVVSQWSEVRSALHSVAWSSVLLSLLAVLGGALTGLMSWRVLLNSQRSPGSRRPVSPVAAGRVFFVGQLGKYVPGSLWSIVLQVELGKREGIARSRVFTALLAWVALTLSSALCVGIVALPLLAAEHAVEAWALVVLLPIAVVASTPPVLTRLVNLVLRAMGKELLPRPLTWSAVARSVGWLVATWALYGLHLWLLADALGTPGWAGLVRCISGFALAMAAGSVFVLLPSGAGVREALIVAALAPVMTTGHALGVAVISRAVFIAADLLTAAVAAISGVRTLRRDRIAAS